MKVTDLQAYLLSHVLPVPLQVKVSEGECLILKRDAMLVRIRTDQGLTGYAPGPATDHAAQLINRNLRSAVIGVDPARTEALRKKIFERRPNFPGLLQAYGAIEIALLDLKARIEGCPLSQLLGGRVRNRLKVYASAGLCRTRQGVVDEALAIAAMGFGAYKMRLGVGRDDDVQAVRYVRSALTAGVDVIVDGRSWWLGGRQACNHLHVESLVRELASLGISWLENPFPAQNQSAYRRLAETKAVPLAAGGPQSSADDLMSLGTQRLVDVVLGNVIQQGGYANVTNLIRTVAQADRTFAFYNSDTALHGLAMAQLGVCFDERVVSGLEWPCFSHGDLPGMYPFPLADEILKEPLSIDRGALIVPAGPGLGIEVNEEIVKRYPWKPGPSGSFRALAPAETLAGPAKQRHEDFSVL